MSPPRPPAASGWLVPIAAGALVGAGALLVALAQEPADVVAGGGALVQTVSLAGSLGPEEASSPHAVEFQLPAGHESPRFNFEADHVEVTLTAGDRSAGGPVRVVLLSASGQIVLESAVDPANPMSAPHGPPTVSVPSGSYTLVVTNEADHEVAYDIRVATTVPLAYQGQWPATPGRWPLTVLGSLVVALSAAVLVRRSTLRACDPLNIDEPKVMTE